MSIEIVGMITPQHQSEIHPPAGPAIDRDDTRRFTQAHEAAGFDRILVPQHSSGPDASQVIAYAAAVTGSVHFLPGVCAAEGGARVGPARGRMRRCTLVVWARHTPRVRLARRRDSQRRGPRSLRRRLLRYVDLGVGTLLIRGFDPLDDASDFGRELIPRLRALVAEREARGQNVHDELPQLLAA